MLGPGFSRSLHPDLFFSHEGLKRTIIRFFLEVWVLIWIQVFLSGWSRPGSEKTWFGSGSTSTGSAALSRSKYIEASLVHKSKHAKCGLGGSQPQPLTKLIAPFPFFDPFSLFAFFPLFTLLSPFFPASFFYNSISSFLFYNVCLVHLWKEEGGILRDISLPLPPPQEKCSTLLMHAFSSRTDL